MKSRAAVYVDSSIVLRRLLRLPVAWKQASTLVHLLASEVLELECIRTIERLRLARRIDDTQLATSRKELGARSLSLSLFK